MADSAGGCSCLISYQGKLQMERAKMMLKRKWGGDILVRERDSQPGQLAGLEGLIFQGSNPVKPCQPPKSDRIINGKFPRYEQRTKA